MRTLPRMPEVGERVRLKVDVDRYPFFVAPAGALGTVIASPDPQSIVFAVRLDVPVQGAEDWENEVHWLDGDAELNGLTVADYVCEYVEASDA